MPYTTHIEVLDRFAHLPFPGNDLIFAFPADWDARAVPNLRRFSASRIYIPRAHDFHPFRSLKHLQFSVITPSESYSRLFHHCPNLITLDIHEVRDGTVLPSGPLPPSLNRVALHSSQGRSVDFGSMLMPWAGQRIPTISIRGAMNLTSSLDFFLIASSSEPVSIVTSRDKVSRDKVDTSLSIAVSDSTGSSSESVHWQQIVIHPFSWRGKNQLLALRGACAYRLTSITVSGDLFGDFFAAQLVMPHLAELTFHLDGSIEPCEVPELPTRLFHLSAPGLHKMTVCVPFDACALCFDRSCAAAVAALCHSLRELITYEAPLLERISVRGEQSVIAFLGCSALAQYARSYDEVSHCHE